jgi:hypothetical protein
MYTGRKLYLFRMPPFYTSSPFASLDLTISHDELFVSANIQSYFHHIFTLPFKFGGDSDEAQRMGDTGEEKEEQSGKIKIGEGLRPTKGMKSYSRQGT